MRIGFIGAGKVGVSLGKYFGGNNCKLSGYYSRSRESANIAAEFTGSGAFNRIEDLAAESDIIFITVTDSQIAEVWGQLKGFDIQGKCICHTSGSLCSGIFEGIGSRGAYGCSVHPMFAFHDRFESYKSLNNACFTLEGSSEGTGIIGSLLKNMGNCVFVIDEGEKTAYHLANVMVSNLVLSLVNIGCTYLSDCGFGEDESVNALMPLIKNNIDNIEARGFISSITGPIERNDLKTIVKHIQVVGNEHLQLYKDLSLNLLRLTELKHPDRNYSEIAELLKG
jgi:predicted short-subunit dehydrogenase-like oxidoreductase (DUF2520 family)